MEFIVYVLMLNKNQVQCPVHKVYPNTKYLRVIDRLLCNSRILWNTYLLYYFLSSIRMKFLDDQQKQKCIRFNEKKSCCYEELKIKGVGEGGGVD